MSFRNRISLILTVPVCVTNEPLGPLVGQASGKIVLGVFGTADTGIRTAAKNAGIVRIISVDLTEQIGVLALYSHTY